jgi:hypothetical protein
MMSEARAKADGLKLVERSKVATLATIGKDGLKTVVRRTVFGSPADTE